jgi:DNA-binding PadR family transcriptional regulator
MSSIRLFVLGGLADEGPMHGHQLRLLAEKEHIDEWTDVTVGALYGAIKRLAAEGLIEEVRSEREGAYPERQVFDITAAGLDSLATIRAHSLREIQHRTDPFDLAFARLDRDRLDELPAVIEDRIANLRALHAASLAKTAAITKHLSVGEIVVMQHQASRLAAEIDWHEHLLTELPAIIADETARKDT